MAPSPRKGTQRDPPKRKPKPRYKDAHPVADTPWRIDKHGQPCLGTFAVPRQPALSLTLPLLDALVVTGNDDCDRTTDPAKLVVTHEGIKVVEVAPGDDGLLVVLHYESLTRIKLDVERWTESEGSTVDMAFAGSLNGQQVAVVAHLDTHDASGFNPADLELAKLFVRTWQQRNLALLADIPLTRALAIPKPGESLACTVPLPPNYDPHDSSTWVAPFVDPPPPPPPPPPPASVKAPTPAASSSSLSAAASTPAGTPRTSGRARRPASRLGSASDSFFGPPVGAPLRALATTAAKAPAKAPAHAPAGASTGAPTLGPARAPGASPSVPRTKPDPTLVALSAQGPMPFSAAAAAAAARVDNDINDNDEVFYTETGRPRRKTTLGVRANYQRWQAQGVDSSAGTTSLEGESGATALPVPPPSKPPRKRSASASASASATPGPSGSSHPGAAAPAKRKRLSGAGLPARRKSAGASPGGQSPAGGAPSPPPRAGDAVLREHAPKEEEEEPWQDAPFRLPSLPAATPAAATFAPPAPAPAPSVTASATTTTTTTTTASATTTTTAALQARVTAAEARLAAVEQRLEAEEARNRALAARVDELEQQVREAEELEGIVQGARRERDGDGGA